MIRKPNPYTCRREVLADYMRPIIAACQALEEDQVTHMILTRRERRAVRYARAIKPLPPHGTRARGTHRREPCSCPACKKAVNDYQQEIREAARQRRLRKKAKR